MVKDGENMPLHLLLVKSLDIYLMVAQNKLQYVHLFE